ncbi:Kyphoscoliosis peptidase [Mizuhopecten yessoensis]|uniref:Kyphoscoliosis peptidase n=2 Tax=Mizuhopecten yessoensis TaxID=6573 RepID=A0A210QAS7_MIZYE|nr:Kyphoscoliosis peptidase [Mizuhopecten yessoensis]
MGNGSSLKIKLLPFKPAPPEKDTLNPIQYATYKFSRKCELSETHHMYVIDKTPLETLPPPHVPHTRKSEIFDLLMYKHIDERAMKVPSDLQKGSMANLVSYLVEPCTDDLGRIRSIYTWLTSQNLNQIKMPLPPIREGCVPYYLSRLKNKKGNYAQLLSLMCRHAKLSCVVVHGCLKGSTYTIGQLVKDNKDILYGEWNAVLVDNVWRLVNAYWGACAVSGDVNQNESAKFCVDEAFFLPDPEQLIYSHFPEESKWQLLETKVSIKQFEKKAYLKERFFELEMRALSHQKCEIVTDNGEIEILFGLPQEKAHEFEFMCLLFSMVDDKWKHIKEKTSQHDFVYYPNDSSVAVRCRFPKIGEYKLEIVGKDSRKKDPGYDFDWVAIYKIKVNGIPEGNTSFPKCCAAGWGPGKTLKESGLDATTDPNAIVFSEGGYVEVSFEKLNRAAAGLNISYKIVGMNKALDDVPMEEEGIQEDDEEYTIEASAPPGEESALCIFAHIDDPSYGTITKNICNYLVISSEVEVVDDSLFRDIEEVRKQLESAIEEKKLEPLENSVDLVETKKYERYMPQEMRMAKDLIARLRKIQELLHAVMALEQPTIAEIRSFSSPLPEIHNVMKATLLLLGNFEDETKQWKNVQAIIGRTGKESLKRRINEFDINTLPLDVALGAKKMIGKTDLADIKTTSQGAATFYVWVGTYTAINMIDVAKMLKVPLFEMKKEKKRKETFI